MPRPATTSSWRTATTTGSSRSCCTRSATPRPPTTRASLRRGQAFSDKIRNEGSGQRDARPDQDRRPHGQRANEMPENYSNNDEKSKPPEMARLPIAMSSDAAQQLMEQLRQRLEIAEIRRIEQRRKRLLQADEPTPW